MSDSEFYEVLLLAMSDMDTQFQFWLSITSAYVITIYMAGARLNVILRTGITLLYLASCILIFFRMIMNSEIVIEILSYKDVAMFDSRMSGIFREIVMMTGTTASIVFALFYKKIMKTDSPETDSTELSDAQTSED